jgi:glycosyltransferase involved in cell wall biosynthesis
MKPFVVYWNNIPAPYMVERFNALRDEPGIEFEAWFNDRVEPGRSWAVDESKWHFNYRYLPSIQLFGKKVRLPLPVLGRKPDLIVSLHAEPVFILGWMIAKLRGSKTVFRVLKTFDSWIRRTPFKEGMKRYLFRRVDGIETTGADGKEYVMRYGVPPDRVFTTTHAFDISHFIKSHSTTLPERTKLRKSLGLKGVTFIYVGRLWHGKGVGDLLEAFQEVQQQSEGEVSLLIVGDGPQEQALKRICASKALENVVFAGFQPRERLPEFYALADVFVFPTLGDPYGLVVDEAMACSLPVISTAAAGEISARIKAGENGFIVPPADPGRLAERMLQLAKNPDLRRRTGERSRSLVEDHTSGRWAREFTGMVASLLREAGG